MFTYQGADPCILTGYRDKDEQEGALEEGCGEEFIRGADDYGYLSMYPPINLIAIFEG